MSEEGTVPTGEGSAGLAANLAAGAGLPPADLSPGPGPEPALSEALGQSWLNGVDQDLVASPAMQNIKDLNGLVKSYVHTKALVGSKIEIPADDAPPEAWGAFWNKVGRPNIPGEYDFSGIEMADGSKDFLSLTAHQLGLTKKQAEGLARAWDGHTQELNKAQQELQGKQIAAINTATQKQLQVEWPGSQYEQNMARANLALDTFINPELRELLANTNLNNHPGVIKAFANIGKLLGEDQALGERMATQGFTASREEALARINSKQLDPTFMKSYTNRDDPGHKQAVEEFTRLYKKAYG